MICTRSFPFIRGIPWHSLRLLAFIAAVLVTAATPAHAVIDTIYVDNTKACPGGPGNTLANAFCSITKALQLSGGGPDKVLAVVATGKEYRERFQIGAKDSGNVQSGQVHPFVLFARGFVTIDGTDTTTRWVQDGDLWRSPVDDASSPAPRQVFLHGVRYHDWPASLQSLPPGRCKYVGAPADSMYVNFG